MIEFSSPKDNIVKVKGTNIIINLGVSGNCQLYSIKGLKREDFSTLSGTKGLFNQVTLNVISKPLVLIEISDKDFKLFEKSINKKILIKQEMFDSYLYLINTS